MDASARRRRAREFLEADPAASTREIAAAAGISPTTAKDVRRRLRVQLGAASQYRRHGEVAPEASPAGLASGSAKPPHSPDRTLMVRRLRADPSLRFTEVGRRLLRLLAIADPAPEEWQSMADSVPPHCASAVAELARCYAESWLSLADSVSRHLGTDT
ncbi:AsnC family protein [Nocardia sp. NPDC050630]|uniref:AsnC family protein n=1 Tax=Nocardia sp. NPDC050630 TaxID=3364321 RepID=UPI0037B77CFB